jgi:hypothetical protein
MSRPVNERAELRATLKAARLMIPNYLFRSANGYIERRVAPNGEACGPWNTVGRVDDILAARAVANTIASFGYYATYPTCAAVAKATGEA